LSYFSSNPLKQASAHMQGRAYNKAN
jgi:hypothetical protein